MKTQQQNLNISRSPEGIKNLIETEARKATLQVIFVTISYLQLHPCFYLK